MITINEKLGMIIRDKRKSKKMTMKELGEKLGVAESTIYCYEKGIRSISIELFFKMCELLEIDPVDVQKQCETLLNNKKG